MKDGNTPAALACATTRRQLMARAVVALGGLTVGPVLLLADTKEEISRTAESIHQEPVFKASPKRVYGALTDAKQFDQVAQMSGAMKSGMGPASKPTELRPEAGAAFFLFGGYVTGRNVELITNQRIVQAWRAGSWDPGVYSIAKFEITEEASGTRIVFDHTGFPVGQAQHLASGWKANYWEPLEKFLS